MRQKVSRTTGVVLITLGLLAGAAAPAEAAQPPKGYQTSQVLATVENPRLGKIPLRRGFWDADSQRGFGMDKAWHKHALTSRAAQKVLLGSTNNKKQLNGSFDLRTYAGKYDCKDQWNCTLREQMLVHAIFDPTTYPNYYGWPVNGKLGMVTAYCDNKGIEKCPRWVTYALTNPGTTNPYRLSGESTEKPEPTPLPAESTQRSQAHPAVLKWSYNELPRTITRE